MRNVMELKDNWMFVKEAENAADAASKKGTAVSLPHTWNAVDGQDGGNDYHRGTCWYVTKFQKPELEAGSQVYVEFLGASVIADELIVCQQPDALAEIVLLVLVVKLDNTLIPSTKEETEQTISELISLLEKGTDNPEGSLNFLKL